MQGRGFNLILIGLFSLSLFIFTTTATASAANHYVRAGATGSGNGSDWTNACADFTGSCTVGSLVRGDTYYVAAGTYASRSFNRATSGTTVITIQKATVADHGTSTGWSDTFATAASTFNGQVNFGTSYWVFDGVAGGGPGSWTGGFGFVIKISGANPGLRTDQVSNITVRHVEIAGTLDSSGGGSIAQDGLGLYGATNFTISYYYIHDVGRCIFFISTQNFIAEYGYTGKYVSTSAAHAELASIWGFAIPSNGVTFRYNVFTHSEGTGGLIFDNEEQPTGAGMKVYGNVFYRPLGDTWEINNGLIGGWTGGNGEQFHNVEVYNNSFINTTSDDGNSPLSTFPNVASGNAAYNNVFFNSNTPNFSKFSTNGFNTVTSSSPFVDPTNLNFSPSAPTAAGISLASPYNFDPLGNLRGSDGVWDRGAYEFGGSAGSSARPAPPTGLTAVVE